jgi:hypothetical protein
VGVVPSWFPLACRAAGAVATAGALWLVSTVSAARPSPPLPAGLPEAERVKLQQITDAADVATRVEAEPFVTRREVFEYLLDHPEFATHVARTLRLARYRIWQTPAGLFLDDGWGVRGHFWVVYTANGTRVIRAAGEYKKALLLRIRGEAVTMIEYDVSPAGDGRSLVRPAVSGFLRLDSRLASFALNVASAASQRKADLEARRLMKVFARVSRALEENPAGVWEQLRQRPDVPRHELEEFGRLLNVR